MRRFILGVMVFFCLSAAQGQNSTTIDPLKYLTNFEAIPTEDGVLNLILHRGSGEVVMHVLDENLEKVHEHIYYTTEGIKDYYWEVKNGKVYILLSWLFNHNYKKEILVYSLSEKSLNTYFIGTSQIDKPADFLVFEEYFVLVGAQKDPIIQVYSFNSATSLKNTIYLPQKKIWHISDADNSISLLTSPKENYQSLEWLQYLPNGELAGQLKLETNFNNKDIETANLIIDSENNPRIIGTTAEKKLQRFHTFFHWAMDNQNNQSFSLIEPQSLTKKDNGLSRKQTKQMNFERKKGFKQVEILSGQDGELLVASIPGKPVSYPEKIYKKQMVHLLRMNGKGELIWDRLVDFDYTTRSRLNELNYRKETFAYLLGSDFYFGHKDNIRQKDAQIVNVFRIDEAGEMTNFSQDLPPGSHYRVKHLNTNEVLIYNETPLFQNGDSNLQYFMGRMKIQEPLTALTNKN